VSKEVGEEEWKGAATTPPRHMSMLRLGLIRIAAVMAAARYSNWFLLVTVFVQVQ
jgi:hypothetical protein